MAPNYIRWFEEIGTGDVASVGGKSSSRSGSRASPRPFIRSQ